MMLTLGQVADWIHAEGDFDLQTKVFGYSIDSRTVAAGELFFAVMGERFDGHEFVETALKAGAAAAVVSTHWVVPAEVDPCKLLRVPESEDCVLKALQGLAHKVRQHWGKRLIGITGSAGKTTTKECVAAVLSAQFEVLKSAGNLNNGFGVPLQLLRLQPEHEVAVIEMGMNHAGEIAALAKIAEPDWAVVSNVAPVHLEHFADGIAGIAAAKFELVQSLRPDGVAFLNADDPYVSTFGRGREARYFGLRGASATVLATDVVSAGADGMRFTVEAGGERVAASIALLGEHNVYNALAGIAVGLESGMTLQACIDALAVLQPSDKRGEQVVWRGARIINDSYNSNPRALDAMVDALMAVEATRHIVIAGEMLELGPDADVLHAECGAYMLSRGVDVVLGVRGHAAALVQGAGDRGVFVASPEDAGMWMLANLREGDAVLLKASRGVRLERSLVALGLGAAAGH
ncbi:UDP-N-acetylmuramoyl-tripeptide--D-alanyl-D-alanine ligase [Terriglobus roseus DSM 18391]|uniref:UDP-N-acetylmuramoyl-tripeptide--D-alanyl-D-alanine ligase n=1 Tax=Terriglobus roseus (strain DSM 18391 / NRRL B-41598 / KBS 63) TaxID=926566 RepID=I3ZK94_TERRK|nr:UDP-N-acetylmuramoyl-tripeptide--D-alanyl-D-alanine ligase [Terriglobus roseus]AFL89662.1 UDP-N-acetylmuramoyl-tripeptide--D-alanyl-D-alanine ligase [Terriglobus roseus DSM 18391]